MNVDADIFFSFIYLVVVLCFILPPKEFAAAGLTIQNLFSSYLGSKDVDFIGYHIRRTWVTVVVHSLLPVVYYIGLTVVSPELQLLKFTQLSSFALLFALCCFGAALCGLALGLLWTYSKYNYHPLVNDLKKYGTPWRGVAAQINLEFRRLEKYSSITGGTSIYVTDSWILKCTAYKVYIAQQTGSHLSILKSEEFQYSHDTNQAAQYIHLSVSSIAPHEQTFTLHLNALEYSELKDRLNAPIRNVRSVVIQQTISDRFLEAFKQQVSHNGTIEIPQIGQNDIENCIGCMVKTANIKLMKRCGEQGDGECQQCYCRPMWCLECMGRWFASRQDQNLPSDWLSSFAPCPTCRAPFCMADVFTI